eukprot:TRINITY_DN241_c0_g2_i1.p1 TRINITY_DN241_c0_g2~~TRINITY_DN241_c0_g2_i1.p1  ORF type:complete len:659 (+),score=219.28 TRINITY_DN241_c0_g2_i1:95-2071(+)
MKTIFPILGGLGLASASDVNFAGSSSEARPVSKVVDLLKSMQDQLEKEGEVDEKTYGDYKCWCKKNGEDKLKAIEEAKDKLPELTSRVEYLEAKAQKLKAEAEKIEDEVAANKASLSTATALRAQQKKEFDSDSEVLGANINAVGEAKSTFGKPNPQGFLQMPQGKILSVNLEKLLDKVGNRITDENRDMLHSFLQGGDVPSTDSVTGVLSGMQDDFNSDLEHLKELEDGNIKAFADLSEAKEAEIMAGTKLIEKKKEEKAEADEERAHKMQEIKDMQGSLGDDVAFAQEVQQKCAVMDKEYDERVTTRNDESQAIAKAVETLDADNAHDVFSKTLALLQITGKSTEHDLREKASSVLMMAGRKLDVRLMQLAVLAKMDSFTKVKKAIDDMVSALKKERAGEVQKRDFCVDAINKNSLETQDKTGDREAVVTKMEALSNNIKQAADQLSSLQAEIEDMKKQLQLASQNREAENTEFQKVAGEQKETQELLKKAYSVLEGFYNKPQLVQVREHDSSASVEEPPKFKDYKKNNKSFGVLGMIQQIMADAKAAEAEAIRAEASNQASYEAFAKDTAKSVESKTKQMSSASMGKARNERDHVESKSSKKGLETEISELGETKTQLEADCSFLMKNFDMRQEAFGEEVDSLNQAKAILSGAKY